MKFIIAIVLIVLTVVTQIFAAGSYEIYVITIVKKKTFLNNWNGSILLSLLQNTWVKDAWSNPDWYQ